MALSDYLGRLFRRSDLAREHAGPAAGARAVTPDAQWAGLTPQRLAALLRQAAQGDTRAYYALAEELEERDSHYCAVLNARKRAVVGLDISVAPADDSPAAAEHAALIERFIARDDLIEELFDLQDAVGKGVALLEIDWAVGEAPLLPRRLIWRDPRHFAWDSKTLSRPLIREDGGRTSELPAWKFVFHRQQAKSGVPGRDGLARQCAFLSLFKSLTVKGWVAFCETYGQPYRVGKYGPNASETDRRTLLDAVLSIAADAGAIIPESMQIEFVQTDVSGSAGAFEALARYANQEISKLVLGQTTTTEAISGGHAVSQEHRLVQDDIERADARALAATLTRDLIVPIIALNFGPQAAYPTLRIGRPEALGVPELVDAVAKLVPFGFQVPQAYLRGRLYLPEPEDGEAVLQGPAADDESDAPDLATAAYSPAQPRHPAGKPAYRQVHDFTPLDLTEDDPEKPTTAAADPVDDLIARLWADGSLQESFAPVIAPIEAAVAAAGSLESLRTKLAEKLTDMDSERFAELLARANLAARLGGETEE